MKSSIRKIVMSLVAITVLTVICVGVFSGSGAVSDDPSANYQVQTAPNEDSTLNLWFEHSTNKVLTSDITPSGMNTYSVYMAKNEIEDAQFVLYSAEDHTGMKATVSEFSDGNGNTLAAEIYYEMYVTTSALDTSSVLGSTAGDSIIRAGETPDPIAPLSNVGSFKLNAGKSQAFLIRVKSTSETASGWYSAQLDIKNSAGEIVKTATVFTYVWNFELSEKTALQTAFYMSGDTSYGGTYKQFYDYMLENRMNAMDIPGTLTSTNEYLMNDRVSAVRVSQNGNGAASIPTYMDNTTQYSSYAAKYAEMSASPNWENFKDKLYFYTADEPMAKEQQDALGNVGGATVDTVKNNSALLANYWPDAQTVVPYHENHPYPYYTYNSPISNYPASQLKDATQEMMDTASVTTWCPQIYSFTPSSVLTANNYSGGYATDKIRNLSGTISGIYAVSNGSGYNYFSGYYNWENKYGDFSDRIHTYIDNQNAAGGNFKLWAYSAGWNKSYTYCNHLIENTGLQSRLLFWQLYQNDVTGYLYYGTNNWTEYTKDVDTTVTGAKTNAKWMTNRHDYATGYSIFGNGVLFYGPNQGRISGINYVGSLRIEEIRDGIEDYQMLTMLEEYTDEATAKAIVSEVSENVANYVSLNGFDTSAWSSDMDEYDIMNAVHVQLGTAVEAAAAEAESQPPVVNVDKTNETVTDTGSAVYTVSATGNSALTYNWTCVSGENSAAVVSGANTAVLTVTVNTQQKEGFTATYKCTVTDADGKTTDSETVTFVYATTYVAPSYTIGDINNDGVVNPKDSNLIQQIISGSKIPTEAEYNSANVFVDNAINAKDANKMIQYLTGIINSFE